MNQKILDRVKKLLSLADSPNENEAATAAALAQREEKLAKALGEIKTETIKVNSGHKNYARYQGQQEERAINIRKTETRLGQ